jgi:diguanylate cyclase (GGDEF)-like protein
MVSNAYIELLKSKFRLSMLLFFFLNGAFALLPLIFTQSSYLALPLLFVAAICLLGSLSTFFIKNKVNHKLGIFSGGIGVLWTWYIVLQSTQSGLDHNFLLISLLGLFFISAIALSENLLAAILYIIPASIAILYLDGLYLLGKTLLTISLPLIGLIVNYLMQKRSSAFTQRMVENLYSEREKFSDLSMLDPLTGLYNRRGLQNKLDTLTPSYASNFLILLDIDHFKAYNDNYGHSMGDQTLVQVATAIRDSVRSRDVVVRYGGEEFLVVLLNTTKEQAIRAAVRIQEEVLQLQIPHHFNNQVSTNVTISIGLSPIIEEDFSSALIAADDALYLAKNSGRNKVICSWNKKVGKTVSMEQNTIW